MKPVDSAAEPAATPERAPRRSARRRAAHAALAVSALLSAGPCLAHDFWLEPSAFRPEAGSILEVGLRVGEHLEGEPVPRNPARIQKFLVVGPDGEAAVAGRAGEEPAGRFRPAAAGRYVIGYRGTRARIDLDAAKFEKYLADEGLERISAVRRERGESARPGREVYSRCAKAIVEVVPPSTAAEGARRPSTEAIGDERAPGRAAAGAAAGSVKAFDHLLGFTLELVPEADPYTPPAPREMPIRILYEGRPLEGALVVATNAGDPLHPQKVRSDRGGRTLFKRDRAGMWLVKAVHMVPAPPDSGADWESLWASLTFEIKE